LGYYFGSHFAPAFYFLTPTRRRALKLLYAVCRVLDDAVDKPTGGPVPFLNAWRRVFQTGNATLVREYGQEGLAQGFLEVVRRFDIPPFVLVDLIDKGVQTDLKTNRFETPLDLERYCYGVAGTVGIACLPIFGVPWQEAKEFAVRLGTAIQWINTIRDVGVDAKLGRIYIPLDHLEQFAYEELDLLAGRKTLAFQNLMKHEAQVARSHYRRAMDLLPPRWERELLPAKVMGRIYLSLLEKIERLEYPVFDRKITLNLWQKAWATWKAIRE
jgi:phytoene synthase